MLNSVNLTTVYWYMAVIGTIVFILKTAFPIDSGTEVDTNFTSVSDTDSSFNLFTIEGISAFFMSGGWMGWFSFSKLHYEMKLSLSLSVISGILGMALFSFLISRFKKLEHIPEASLNELVNKCGRAYMKFAPKSSSKIEIEYNSKLSILDAINLEDEVINAFEPIKVIKVENGCVYIKKDN